MGLCDPFWTFENFDQIFFRIFRHSFLCQNDRCRKNGFEIVFLAKLRTSKNSKNFGQIFRMSKNGPEAPTKGDHCRKMVLRSTIRQKTILVKIFKCAKKPQRPLQYEIDVEKCFL